jgi:hypothetical protein
VLNSPSSKKLLVTNLVVLLLGQINLAAFAAEGVLASSEPESLPTAIASAPGALDSSAAEPTAAAVEATTAASAADAAMVVPAAESSLSSDVAMVAPTAAPAADSAAAVEPMSPASEPAAAQVGRDDAMPPLRLSGSAAVTPAESEGRIENLTKQIMLKTIELEKFNLHYNQEVAKQGRWKGIRYATFGEINAGLGLAGAIISVAYRGDRIHHANKVKPCIQESANYIPMIGSIIGASAAVIELGVNEYHDLQARRKGFSPKAAVNHVLGLKSDIDKLFAEREAMINEERKEPSLSAHVAVNEAEGHVLKDLRDQSLQEFQRFHVGARRTLAFQQAQYFFDFAKNTTNAIGYDFAYLSLHRHHRIWNGRAGVMWDITGPLFMFGPIISRVVGKGVGELARANSKGVVKDTDGTIKTLEGDLASLNNLVAVNRTNPDPVLKAVERTGMYDIHQKNFTNEIVAADKSRNAAKLVATQNIGAGLYVGATKLASGILFTIPGYNHHYNSTTARAGRVTNDLLFTGSLIAIPAGAFTMLDTLRIQVQGELKRAKLKKAGQLASQLTAARLKELDTLEAKLKAM